jgi:hypothetical protein
MKSIADQLNISTYKSSSYFCLHDCRGNETYYEVQTKYNSLIYWQVALFDYNRNRMLFESSDTSSYETELIV